MPKRQQRHVNHVGKEQLGTRGDIWPIWLSVHKLMIASVHPNLVSATGCSMSVVIIMTALLFFVRSCYSDLKQTTSSKAAWQVERMLFSPVRSNPFSENSFRLNTRRDACGFSSPREHVGSVQT